MLISNFICEYFSILLLSEYVDYEMSSSYIKNLSWSIGEK